MQEYSDLEQVVSEYQKLKNIDTEIENSELLLTESNEQEIKELAKQELNELNRKRKKIVSQIKILLIPKNPLHLKDIIMEIRAGTGGEEAALFAADLFRMYSKYAESKNWCIFLIKVL